MFTVSICMLNVIISEFFAALVVHQQSLSTFLFHPFSYPLLESLQNWHLTFSSGSINTYNAPFYSFTNYNSRIVSQWRDYHVIHILILAMDSSLACQLYNLLWLKQQSMIDDPFKTALLNDCRYSRIHSGIRKHPHLPTQFSQSSFCRGYYPSF